MKDKFKITEEEINGVILNSPYSLPDSPASQGLRASTVKKYFYSFIRVLAKKLNIHLEDIGAELARLEDKQNGIDLSHTERMDAHDIDISAHKPLMDMIVEQLESIMTDFSNEMNDHDKSATAHENIRMGASRALSDHNASQLSHMDIRALVESAYQEGRRAYQLASGKSKVFPVGSLEKVLEHIEENETLAGDVFIIEDKLIPDLVCFGRLTDTQAQEEIESGALSLTPSSEIEVGQVCIYSGVKLVATESGIDVSALTKKSDHNELLKRVLDNENALENYVYDSEMKIACLEEKDAELGSSISSTVASHNSNPYSHQPLRDKIYNDILAHNESGTSHTDVRKRLDKLDSLAQVAYNLASGKGKVYSFESVDEMFNELVSPHTYAVGDVFMIKSGDVSDFTVFKTGQLSMSEGEILVTLTDLLFDSVTFEAGKAYYYEGTTLIASGHELETSELARNEDLELLEMELDLITSNINSTLDTVISDLKGKEESVKISEESGETVYVKNHTEHRLGLRTSIILDIDTESELEAQITFRSGATPTAFDAPADLYFTQDDCLDGVFYPISNRIYEISIKTVCDRHIARVGAVDYEVVE